MTEFIDQLLPVVLCGGSGSRLWPLSRETYPKPFLSLGGERSMLQETVLRLKHGLPGIDVADAPILVCNNEHRFIVAEQLNAIGTKNAKILLEPVSRNTAPALTIAALQAIGDNSSENPVLLVMPADHVVERGSAFRCAMQRAYRVASRGGIVTFGILPDRPETGYGYILRGSVECEAEFDTQVYRVDEFVEKPDAKTAAEIYSNKQYLWNSGIFMVRAREWLTAIKICRPDILKSCSDAMHGAIRDLDFIRPKEAAFAACPTDSIDYAVMERLPSKAEVGITAYVVPFEGKWSDLGTWDTIGKYLERDEEGNALVGQAIARECRDTILFGTNRLIAGVGLNGVIIVETPDAVLAIDKHHTQEVKHIVSRLKEEGYDQAIRHRKTHRPWGWYDVIDRGEKFVVKRIMVNPGASLSLQLHRFRAEHWVVVNGIAYVRRGNDGFYVKESESIYIPVGDVHRLTNPGERVLEIIEVQTGDRLSEDDIERIEDDYGRVSI